MCLLVTLGKCLSPVQKINVLRDNISSIVMSFFFVTCYRVFMKIGTSDSKFQCCMQECRFGSGWFQYCGSTVCFVVLLGGVWVVLVVISVEFTPTGLVICPVSSDSLYTINVIISTCFRSKVKANETQSKN